MRSLSIAALIIFANLIQAYSQQISWGEAFSPFTPNYQLEPVQELGPTFDAEAETNGKIHTVWGGISASGLSKIYYSTYSAGVFSAPQQLSAPGSLFAFAPDLDILPDGRVAAVWSEYTASGSSKAMSSIRALNGSWSTPAVINPSGDEAAFVVVSHLPDGRPVAAYSVVEFDEINEKLLSNIKMRVLGENNTWANFPTPPVQIVNSNYRPGILLADEALYCAWIDGGNPDEVPSNNYVALSTYQNGTWSTRQNLSAGYSLQIIDDTPIQLKKSANNEVSLLWNSFLPFSQQTINLSSNTVITAPFTSNGTGAPVFSPTNQLIIISDDLEDGELFISQLDNNDTWETPTLLHNTASEYIEFPEAVTWKDSILVLWLQEGSIKVKTGKFLTSAAHHVAPHPSFKIYPNPNTGCFFIENLAVPVDATITLFDHSGKMVFTQIAGPKTYIDLGAQLADGVYWAFIKSPEQPNAQSFKIIKTGSGQ